MNNFEKIKNMSEEELAVFLTNMSGYMDDNDEFVYDGPTRGSLTFGDAVQEYLDWFKQNYLDGFKEVLKQETYEVDVKCFNKENKNED